MTSLHYIYIYSKQSPTLQDSKTGILFMDRSNSKIGIILLTQVVDWIILSSGVVVLL